MGIQENFNKLLRDQYISSVTVEVAKSTQGVNNYHAYFYAPKAEKGISYDVEKIKTIKAGFKANGCYVVAGFVKEKDKRELICVLYGSAQQFENGFKQLYPELYSKNKPGLVNFS
jgi:hypothetical protein